MQVADNRRCFICGVNNPIGLKVRPSRDETAGRAWLSVIVPIEFQGWAGVVHGGIIAALLDEVSAYAAMGVSKQIVTAELKIRYLKPVPVGREVSVVAELREQARRSITIEASLSCDGEICARAEARMVVLKAKSESG